MCVRACVCVYAGFVYVNFFGGQFYFGACWHQFFNSVLAKYTHWQHSTLFPNHKFYAWPKPHSKMRQQNENKKTSNMGFTPGKARQCIIWIFAAAPARWSIAFVITLIGCQFVNYSAFFVCCTTTTTTGTATAAAAIANRWLWLCGNLTMYWCYIENFCVFLSLSDQ